MDWILKYISLQCSFSFPFTSWCVPRKIFETHIENFKQIKYPLSFWFFLNHKIHNSGSFLQKCVNCCSRSFAPTKKQKTLPGEAVDKQHHRKGRAEKAAPPTPHHLKGGGRKTDPPTWCEGKKAKLRAWVRCHDMCLEGQRGVARALESKLKECMLMERRAELGWPMQTTRTSLHSTGWLTNGRQRFETDPRHVQIALHNLGIDETNAKPLSSPGAHDHEFSSQGELQEEGRTGFRSITVRLAFLVGRPRCVQRFPFQPEVQSLTVKVDSDFAGGKGNDTRSSTNCFILMCGTHVLRCSSSTHKIQGWKSGESEFIALVRGGSVGFGAKALAEDSGRKFGFDLETGSSAARDIATRRGWER